MPVQEIMNLHYVDSGAGKAGLARITVEYEDAVKSVVNMCSGCNGVNTVGK